MNNEGIIKDVYEKIIKEFQTILYIFYILIIVIGMIFSNYEYGVYNINIFEYATIFDFLIMPFKDITIIIFSILSIFLVSLVYFLPKLFLKRKNENEIKTPTKFEKIIRKSKLSGVIGVLVVFFLFYNYTSTIAEKYALRNKRNIIKKSNAKIELTTREVVIGKLIGKTENYIFLLENNQIRIIPINSTKSIIKEIKNE